MTYSSEVLADLPLAYYDLGESSGTTMVDSSGNGRDGVIDAGVTLGASSIVPNLTSTAWTLNAAEGGRVAGASWMAPASAFTAEAWIYLTSYATETVVMARSDVAASNSRANKAWAMQVSTSGAILGRLYTDSGSTAVPTSAAGVVPLNTLCHVVLVYDGSNAVFYVNGSSVATAALSGVPVSWANNTKPLTIGRSEVASTYAFNGKIQAAAFYDSALSSTRIAAHYGAGLGDPQLSLVGSLPTLTSNFTIATPRLFSLAGTLTRPTSAFSVMDQRNISAAGSLTRPTSVFEMTSQPAIALAGTLTRPTSDFRLLSPVNNQPSRVNTISFAFTGGIDEPIIVNKPTGLSIGDLMVIAIILRYPGSPDSDVRAQNLLDEDNLNLNAPFGWTFEGASISYVDYTNYVGGGSTLNSVRPQEAVAVFTKRITHADTDDVAVPSYTFTRDPWIDSSDPSGFTESWSHADVSLIIYRYGKFAGLSKDWIGYGFKTPPPDNIVDDTLTGHWRGAAPAGSTKVVTQDLAPVPNNALGNKALGVTIATPATYTTNGSMVHTTSANVSELGSLEGPTAAPPTLTRTIPAGGSYVGAAVGFILEPVDASIIAQVPLPTASLTGVAETTGHFNAAVPMPEVAITGDSTDPTPVGNVADYILTWDPAFFFKLNQAHASNTNISFTDSSGYGRHATSAYITVAQLQGNQPGLLSSTYAQTAMRFSPTSTNILLAGYALADQVDTGQISVVERVRPEANGPLVVREWGAAGYTQWGLFLVANHLVARVMVGNVTYEVTDPDPIILDTAYTVGFKWDGDDLSLFRDGVKVATTTPDTALRLMSTVSFDDIYISSGYYTAENTPATHANLAIFNYGIPDSVFTNIHRLSVTDQAMVTDPPIWGESQPPAASVTDGYGLAVLADSPAYFFRLNESDTADLFRDSSGNGRDVTRQPRINIPFTPPDMGGPGLVPSSTGSSMDLAIGATLQLSTAQGTPPSVSTAWSVEFLLRRTTYTTSVRTAKLNFGAYNKTLELGVKGVEAFGGAYTNAVNVTGYSHADDVAPSGWETRYHYVLTCDGVTLKLYADGALIGTKDVSGTTGGGATYFSSPPVYLEFDGLFSAYVDEIAIYPSVLSGSRVTAHWTATGLTSSGLAEAPVIPPPATRGLIAEEDFEGGTVGSAPLPANTIFGFVGPDARFVSGGLEGQGVGAAANDDPSMAWADIHKNTPKLYYRAMVKVDLADGELGSDLTFPFFFFGEYLTETYESYYPYGYPTAYIGLVGSGGTGPGDPVVLAIEGASTDNASTFLKEELAQIDPAVWYMVEAEYVQDTEALKFRISDETGVLIYESILTHKPIPLSLISAPGKGAPLGFQLKPATTLLGTTVVMDNVAVGDDTWLGLGEAPAEPVVVVGGQALETDTAPTGAVQIGFVTVVGSWALEADEVLPGSILSDILIQGQTAVETEIALPGSATGEAFVPGGTAEEVQTLLPVGRALEVGTVEVLDLALAGSYPQFALAGQIVVPAAQLAALNVGRSVNIGASGVLSVGTESMTVIPEMRLVILDRELHRAPTSITIMLAGGVPEQPVEFYIDGTLVWTTETDSEGGLDATSISVTTTVGGAIGNHVVEARQIISSGILTGSDTYSLSRHPATAPSVMNSDAQAVEIPEALVGQVRRWVFQDLLAEEEGGLGSYILPMNPQEMTSPVYEKSLSSKHSTAVTGQFHISEAGNIPKDWTFKGYCPSDATRLRMMEYRNLNRRFYIIDHRNRAWKVVAISANFTPRLRHVFNAEIIDGYDYEFTVTVVDQEWVTPA